MKKTITMLLVAMFAAPAVFMLTSCGDEEINRKEIVPEEPVDPNIKKLQDLLGQTEGVACKLAFDADEESFILIANSPEEAARLADEYSLGALSGDGTHTFDYAAGALAVTPCVLPNAYYEIRYNVKGIDVKNICIRQPFQKNVSLEGLPVLDNGSEIGTIGQYKGRKAMVLEFYGQKVAIETSNYGANNEYEYGILATAEGYNVDADLTVPEKDWHVPTVDELRSLAALPSEWTTRYNPVTEKVVYGREWNYRGKSLFIPAAGYAYPLIMKKNERGSYMSCSTVYTNRLGMQRVFVEFGAGLFDDRDVYTSNDPVLRAIRYIALLG